jgi:hypothetical protein
MTSAQRGRGQRRVGGHRDGAAGFAVEEEREFRRFGSFGPGVVLVRKHPRVGEHALVFDPRHEFWQLHRTVNPVIGGPNPEPY